MSKFSDGVSTAADYTNSISELVSSKKELVIKQSINVVLLLIILLAFGCFDWMHLTFKWEYLGDPNFWINVFVKAAADIAAYNIGINVILDDLIKRNKTLVKLKKTYDELNKYKEDDFEDFIDLYNLEYKIACYKHQINYKIYRLNKHAKNRDKLLYSRKGVSEEAKIQNKYCVKRKELEQLRTDEYIKENIDSLEVKYIPVDAAIFELEINGAKKVTQNKVTGSITKGRLVMSATTLIGIIAVPIVINSIALQPNGTELAEGAVAAVNYAIRMASDIGVIFWQFSRGIFATPKIVSQQLTNPLEERVKILKKYYSWRLKKGLTVPQYFTDLTKEQKEEEIIELTPEQLDKAINE